MRLSKAPRKVFPHADVDGLREVLARGAGITAATASGEPHRLILVVTDGVFSMDGDIAPLPGIVEVGGGVRRRGDGRRRARVGRARHGRPRVGQPLRPRGPGRDPGGHAVEGGRRRSAATWPARRRCATCSSSAPGRSCSRRRSRPPSSAACREAIRIMVGGAGAHRAAVGQHPPVQGRARPAGLRHRHGPRRRSRP